jgi:hypothetical protein
VPKRLDLARTQRNFLDEPGASDPARRQLRESLATLFRGSAATSHPPIGPTVTRKKRRERGQIGCGTASDAILVGRIQSWQLHEVLDSPLLEAQRSQPARRPAEHQVVAQKTPPPALPRGHDRASQGALLLLG